MEASKIKAVVFDCDGVMFDTALANRRFYDEVLERFKKPKLSDTQFVQVHMMTVRAAVAYLFPEKEDVREVYAVIKGIGYKKFIRYMQIEPGLKALLAALKENGYIRAVATNRTDTMEKVLADYDLEEGFEMVMTAANVKNPKPDPEQLLTIMNRFNLSPDQVLFIGDSEYDQMAASAAGTAFAAFKQPALPADVHLTAMAQVQELLKINE